MRIIMMVFLNYFDRFPSKTPCLRDTTVAFIQVRRCAEALRRGVQLPVAEPEALEALELCSLMLIKSSPTKIKNKH